MKSLPLYILMIISLIQCRNKERDNFIIKIDRFDNGKTKDSLTLNLDSIKNGKCFYYNYNGNIDSIVTFQDGKRNGLKSKFFGQYGTYTYEYKDDTLIEEKDYDTLNRVIYLAPFDIKKVPKITFKFSSNRLFFDGHTRDTISFYPKVPAANENMSISGALFTDVDDNDNVRAIIPLQYPDTCKTICIKIKISERYGSDPSIPTRTDTLLIPIK